MPLFKPSKQKLFDPIRKSWVCATPEERVRQYWIKVMVEELNYPKAHIAVEKKLVQLTEEKEVPDRRFDILCSIPDKGAILRPLLVIECKSEANFKRAFKQLVGYNDYLKAPFLSIAWEGEIRLAYRSGENKDYLFLDYLPKYDELVSAIRDENSSP